MRTAPLGAPAVLFAARPLRAALCEFCLHSVFGVSRPFGFTWLALGLIMACSAGDGAPRPGDERANVGTSPSQGTGVETAGAAAAPSTSLATLGERALGWVRVLADEIGSRPAGSAAERQAAQLIADDWAAMGYSVEITPFSFTGAELTANRRTVSGISHNVVASDPFEDLSAPLVIVGAHYDSVTTSPGANDNASGTAVVIELARELAAQPIPGVAVRYVAFGAEEVGLYGSRHMANNLSAADRGRLRIVLSIDMMAVGDQPAFYGSEPWISHAAARAASQGWSPVRLPANFRRLSDHASFLEAGLPAMMLHWVEDPCWHLACDVTERVQYHSLELMGAIAMDLIRIASAGQTLNE